MSRELRQQQQVRNPVKLVIAFKNPSSYKMYSSNIFRVFFCSQDFTIGVKQVLYIFAGSWYCAFKCSVLYRCVSRRSQVSLYSPC